MHSRYQNAQFECLPQYAFTIRGSLNYNETEVLNNVQVLSNTFGWSSFQSHKASFHSPFLLRCDGDIREMQRASLAFRANEQFNSKHLLVVHSSIQWPPLYCNYFCQVAQKQGFSNIRTTTSTYKYIGAMEILSEKHPNKWDAYKQLLVGKYQIIKLCLQNPEFSVQF